METKLETLTIEDVEAYNTNAKVFSGGLGRQQVKDYYNDWVDQYEKDLAPGRYNGPQITAEFVDHSFTTDKDKAVILDVAAGTGLVGEELANRGFKYIHALDPSEGMLNKAKKKKVYSRFICEFLTEDELPVPEDFYDCVTSTGGFGDGHIPCEALHELIRITKPGGVIVLVMREEYINQVNEYKGKLEELMHQLQNQGKWMKMDRTIVHRYFCDKTGIVFRYRVLHQHL